MAKVKNIKRGAGDLERRRTIDAILVLFGTAAAVFMLVSGTLAWWGYDFASSSVYRELSAQNIYFPAKGSVNFSPAEFPDIQKYAGQRVDNGLKAKAYANGFIARHLSKIAGGKTYAEVSTMALQDPENTELQSQKQALFQGETLRGLLLGDGYAFWVFGQLALAVSIASFAGATIMALLIGLGLRHMNSLII